MVVSVEQYYLLRVIMANSLQYFSWAYRQAYLSYLKYIM